jgi:hypothetical protein
VAADHDFARAGPTVIASAAKQSTVPPPLPRRFPGASSADAPSRRSALVAPPLERMSRGKVDCVAALPMTGNDSARLSLPLARRRALRHARTKSELLLARLRRSWHIAPQWNSSGCRRRLRPARPTLKKSRSFQKRPTPPLSSPSLVPRCREPQKAADCATSGASASGECLVERWIASLNDGGAVPLGFLCRIPRARRQARTKSEL